MPIVIGLFLLLPLGAGAIAEYVCCRLSTRRLVRLLPPAAVLALTALAAAVRLEAWQSQTASPLTQLLLFPGLPCAALLLGCLLGARLWRRVWGPRVIDERHR